MNKTNDFTFDFDKIEDSAPNLEGLQKLTIIACEDIVSATKGSKMIQFTYNVNDSTFKIQFDNCPYLTINGDPISFGQKKLKSIVEAVGLSLKGDIKPKMLTKMLVGKSFMAELIKNPTNPQYLQLSNNFGLMTPVTTGAVTPATFMKTPEPTNSPDGENNDFVQPVDIDTDI